MFRVIRTCHRTITLSFIRSDMVTVSTISRKRERRRDAPRTLVPKRIGYNDFNLSPQKVFRSHNLSVKKAKKLIGLKAKLYNKERRKEKIEMKKKILMHEKNNTKVAFLFFT